MLREFDTIKGRAKKKGENSTERSLLVAWIYESLCYDSFSKHGKWKSVPETGLLGADSAISKCKGRGCSLRPQTQLSLLEPEMNPRGPHGIHCEKTTMKVDCLQLGLLTIPIRIPDMLYLIQVSSVSDSSESPGDRIESEVNASQAISAEIETTVVCFLEI